MYEPRLVLSKTQPIPHGGQKLLFAITAYCLITTSSILAVANYWDEANMPLLAYCAIGIIVGCIAVPIWIFSKFRRPDPDDYFSHHPGWPASWLIRYWKNNVIGHDVWIQLDAEGNLCPCEYPRGSIVTNRYFDGNLPNCPFIIDLPIGGWRINHRGKILIFENRAIRELNGWSIELHRYDEYERPLIILRITDRRGNQIKIDAKEIIASLNHISNKRGALPDDFQTLICHLNSYARIKHAKCERAEGQLASALDILFTRSQEMRNTSRFGKSKEGKRLREAMEADLLNLLAPNDPRRAVLSPPSTPPEVPAAQPTAP